MQTQLLDFRKAIRLGLIAGVVLVYLSLTGLIETFAERSLVDEVISLGNALQFLPMFVAGYVYAKGTPLQKSGKHWLNLVLGSALAGLIVAAFGILLVYAGLNADLREVFINASPTLYRFLMLGAEGLDGAIPFLLSAVLVAVFGAVLNVVPVAIKRPITTAVVAVFAAGLFAGLVKVLLIARPGWPNELGRFLFGIIGLTKPGAAITFVVALGISLLTSMNKQRVTKAMPDSSPRRKAVMRWLPLALAALFAFVLPIYSGPFIAQVVVLISLYVLMSLGLNITLGFAGLLDLGFVAFFAMGAYTVALLSSYGPLGLAHLPFWAIIPIAVLVSMAVGAVLGLPVLGIRGDYLAIATLGFGEIVRLLAGSDFLGQWLGGPQGIVGIQKPCVGFLGPDLGVGVPRICNGFELGTPATIYYLAVIAALLVAFIAVRLRDSRLGRAWMAIREDEDVAEAMGINLVQTKLMAYILGASFAGLGGAIFAVLVGSIFASSMQLTVSINVVAIIIVGGMGSIPGVVVGALALIGLPELFREFSEYRFLFYGVALIAMMLARPEGLLPYAAVRRELHAEEGGGEATGKSSVDPKILQKSRRA